MQHIDVNPSEPGDTYKCSHCLRLHGTMPIAWTNVVLTPKCIFVFRFVFKMMHSEMSWKYRPFCLAANLLTDYIQAAFMAYRTSYIGLVSPAVTSILIQITSDLSS